MLTFYVKKTKKMYKGTNREKGVKNTYEMINKLNK